MMMMMMIGDDGGGRDSVALCMAARRRFMRLQQMTTATADRRREQHRLVAKTADDQGFTAEPRRHVGGRRCQRAEYTDRGWRAAMSVFGAVVYGLESFHRGVLHYSQSASFSPGTYKSTRSGGGKVQHSSISS